MVGCAARILKVIKLAKDNFSVILQGVSRFEVSTFDGAEPFLSAKVRSVPVMIADLCAASLSGSVVRSS